MHDTVSTDLVEPGQRLAYWTDMVCGVYVQLECDAAGGRGDIQGHIAVENLASLQLSRVDSTPQRVRRTAALVSRASEDFFLVSIQTEGEGVVHQDGRSARLTAGDFAVYDSTRPYTLQFDRPFQQFVLRLPGPILRTALRDTHRLTAITVSGQRGAGHLMINMIRALASGIETLATESATAVAESVTQILVAGLAGLPQARQRPLSRLRAYHRERIKACVREHLREPGFGAADVAARLHVSPSTLQRAWSGEACALGDWIWAQRLDAARRELCDPGLAARGVSEIAFGWGFNDAAHFSRAFRARFGCRRARRAAAVPEPAQRMHTTPQAAIRRLTTVDPSQLESLAGLLVDCVDGGASVGFMHPLPHADARDFWQRVGDEVRWEERALLVAEDADGIVGTVQLVLAQPPNQPHRADLAKMLVHRRARRQGIGEALMRAAEALARQCDKTLLVLDTVAGSDAERLYARLGWCSVGRIPGYALLPLGGLCDTHYFYRRLDDGRTTPAA